MRGFAAKEQEKASKKEMFSLRFLLIVWLYAAVLGPKREPLRSGALHSISVLQGCTKKQLRVT